MVKNQQNEPINQSRETHYNRCLGKTKTMPKTMKIKLLETNYKHFFLSQSYAKHTHTHFSH